MMMRPLPKSLREFFAKHPERFDEGWTEKDYSEGEDKPWSHWVYLKRGWHNAIVDPAPGLHIIHESSIREVKRQYRKAKVCSCDDCTGENK